MPLQPGRKLGPYEIVAPIAGATHGAYKASDTRQNRSVTLHALPVEFANNAEIKDRFDRETKTIASLNHPHICAPIDIICDDDGASYFVTEYLEGEKLATRLARGPLEIDEALRIAIAIADALDKAHRRGIAHRGLTPSNVMLTPKG